MYDKFIERDQRTCDRKGERGAALLTVLCMSTLLLAVGGALIMVTTTATRTAVDSPAELQAFYSAEAIFAKPSRLPIQTCPATPPVWPACQDS